MKNMADAGNFEKEEIEGATERLISKLKNEKLNEEMLKRAIKEHRETMDVISKMTNKLNYKIIVPFSKIAFYEGEIKYTNNVYQDIGCNTYCERTAENAHAFLQKRVDLYEEKYKVVSDSINTLTKEIELSLELNKALENQNKGDLNNIFLRPDGFLEIREEYHGSDDEHLNNYKNKVLTGEQCTGGKPDFKKDSTYEKEKREHVQTEGDNAGVTQIVRPFKTRTTQAAPTDDVHCRVEGSPAIYEQKTPVTATNKVSKIKSLNVNEQGLLNIKENYSSSESGSEGKR
ncbi:conserved Plasmodium protein, unknown function [Plasmodium ovale]|uniref:Uncharacterized protein n=2 Tax=Plasmodium ovale TaxID=36330 RepID=A0A1A8VQA6_PLAOA|nr:hypothetical protein POVCU2_0012430 [Plasmodium ovale curtisi]SBS84824.1 hypothetical protein POVCU1_011490 [Plasmodium ovale curtisi]SCQ16062.1 conserved Plasmodium protein, unknown function [Plasmodium ovale]